MKKIIFILTFVLSLLLCTVAYADNECMKISMGGEVKQAKDIGTGKGISFTLPDLENNENILYAIELAIFEKSENDTTYHIYKDDDGVESKKYMIENPRYLTVQVDFGNANDYREKCKYKIAYRYYLQSVYDLSKIMIAGEDSKEGWRLVGEENSIKATNDGFMFYKNSTPTIEVTGFKYYKHYYEGDELNEALVSELNTKYLPKDAFSNGVYVNYKITDYDKGDTSTVRYVLKDATTGQVIKEDILNTENKITADVNCKSVSVEFTVTDNFGAYSKSDVFTIMIDNEEPIVVSEFDDKGYVVKGEYLFSDFEINDDTGKVMDDGTVMAEIYDEDSFVEAIELEKNTNGKYRLNYRAFINGTYRVELYITDKSGNMSRHQFWQTIDSTKPKVKFIEPTADVNATWYSKWMNAYKNFVFEATDEGAGVISEKINYNGSVYHNSSMSTGQASKKFTVPINITKTGKLSFTFYVYDNAKTANKTTNTVDVNSTGNYYSVTKQIWIDRTLPTISCSVNEAIWTEPPYEISASFNDYSSTTGAGDASGIKTKQYAICTAEDEEPLWVDYTGPVTIETGGIYYIHFKAEDNAGNVATLVKVLKLNTPAYMTTKIEPTDNYRHTIYYSEDEFYVVKNSSYNTKYHFGLYEADLDDKTKVNVKLISQDDSKYYSECENVIEPSSTPNRDIVFNMSYIASNGKALPDGVYSMYLTVIEVKSDGSEVTTTNSKKVCDVVIKRNAPPTPVISVSGGYVNINYPEEPLAGSLNTMKVRMHYKKQYKKVKTGDPMSNIYMNYTDKFKAENMTVTALYTDIAGNTSISTKKIFDDGNGGSDKDKIDATTDGSNTTVEESRTANVYYIGVRRNKQKGINSDIFGFLK